jgi:TPR repeat protein
MYQVLKNQLITTVIAAIILSSIPVAKATQLIHNSIKEENDAFQRGHIGDISPSIQSLNGEPAQVTEIGHEKLSQIIQKNPEIILQDSRLQENILTYYAAGVLTFKAINLAPLIPDLKERAVSNRKALWLLIKAEVEKDAQVSKSTTTLILGLKGNDDNFSYVILGKCYRQGWGVEQNDEECIRWLLKAAERGDEEAQNTLGVCYEHGGGGVEQNDAEAIRWYLEAAKQGSGAAQYNLALCYDYGRCIEQNDAEAIKWYLMAAEKGVKAAQTALAFRYEDGWYAEKDEKEAVKWYRKAAKQGDVNAQYKLGGFYLEEKGVERNVIKAMKWYRKAAEQGHEYAQYILSVNYENEDGVKKDEEEALKWCLKAARQAEEERQHRLSLWLGGLEDLPSLWPIKSSSKTLKYSEQESYFSNSILPQVSCSAPSFKKGKGKECEDSESNLPGFTSQSSSSTKRHNETSKTKEPSSKKPRYEDPMGHTTVEKERSLNLEAEVVGISTIKTNTQEKVESKGYKRRIGYPIRRSQGSENKKIKKLAKDEKGKEKEDIEEEEFTDSRGTPLSPLSREAPITPQSSTNKDIEHLKEKREQEWQNMIALFNDFKMSKQRLRKLKYEIKLKRGTDEESLERFESADLQYKLACFFDKGILEDFKVSCISKAIKWYRKAAANGNAQAVEHLKKLGKEHSSLIALDANAIGWRKAAYLNCGHRPAEEDLGEDYQFKLSQITFMKLKKNLVPEEIVKPKLEKHSNSIYGPLYITGKNVPYEDAILCIDPAGKGDDETAYCIAKRYKLDYFVLASGGYGGKYIFDKDERVPKDQFFWKIADLIWKYKIKKIHIEDNQSQVTRYTERIEKAMEDRYAFLREKYKASDIGKLEIEGFSSQKNKEGRIEEGLKFHLGKNYIIVNRKVLQKDFKFEIDPPKEIHFKLFHQLTYFNRLKKNHHDDRLDAMVMALDKLRGPLGSSIKNNKEDLEEGLN